MIILQNCSKLYKIKILIFEKPDEQLKLASACIKNKLF